jgi:hypothetical protein
MSIREFCRLHGISEDQFYKMKREGWGPITMKVGSRTLISHESHHDGRDVLNLVGKENEWAKRYELWRLSPLLEGHNIRHQRDHRS